jgi:8-oxo-dGTP pyrophosphatase MutT (NUDIX family)
MADDRAAARILCVDGRGRVLLLRWRDPVSGVAFWEPPGGGLEDGETPLAAARRELWEETGLPGDAVVDHWVPVHRDYRWLGVHYVKIEPFYLAGFDEPPSAVAEALSAEESGAYLSCAWLHPEEVAALTEDVEPPNLLQILTDLMRKAS